MTKSGTTVPIAALAPIDKPEVGVDVGCASDVRARFPVIVLVVVPLVAVLVAVDGRSEAWKLS